MDVCIQLRNISSCTEIYFTVCNESCQRQSIYNIFVELLRGVITLLRRFIYRLYIPYTDIVVIYFKMVCSEKSQLIICWHCTVLNFIFIYYTAMRRQYKTLYLASRPIKTWNRMQLKYRDPHLALTTEHRINTIISQHQQQENKQSFICIHIYRHA